ncbi:dephospho-CoA kinase [Mycolicibacterium tokaiense]|uniref:Dephospho-CoA kinase n=1 Tax=Mycolicibacterium tokaiense TaxID=39695 RepID=A0A378TQW2_9MYCO|nr:dephospho-CoA kinase [Mycolicibacterium tokaiense]BBY89448.1 dephospho-CoA kinase [Mycolicibacterium tokaiense]STZ62165.1 dephospho-CoA kinase [Mycolicibacterium tokaiense]
MLRIGLSGGIGAGKSSVSKTFAEYGAVIVDGDVIAREVVEPGTPGLASLVEAFGEGILQADGALDRPALASIAFSDDDKRKTLNGIVHPLVGKRRAELIEAAAPDAVIIEDIPLLVESGMAPLFPLVIIVHADEEVRVRRLIEYRGFSEDDARARIKAQATEQQRRAVADVWLDNTGTPQALVQKSHELWQQRILPFAHNLEAGLPAAAAPELVAYDPSWPEQAQRILARLNTACGHRALRVDHIGSTAVPGLDAKDVIDIQVTVDSLATADELAAALLTAGYPRLDGITGDVPKPQGRSTVTAFDHTTDESLWHKRLHASADPGRPTNVHLRVVGWPNQQFALLFTAWINDDPAARQEYLTLEREVDAYGRAWEWAERTGWRP